MIVNPSLPSGFVVFCDDVRREVTGKLIYVGVYSGQMVVGAAAPIVVPQLCAAISLRVPVIKSAIDAVISIFQSGREEPIFSAQVHLDPLPDELSPSAIQFDPEPEAIRFHMMFVVAELPPIEIREPCVLRVRAFIGDDEVRLGALQILTSPATDAA